LMNGGTGLGVAFSSSKLAAPANAAAAAATAYAISCPVHHQLSTLDCPGPLLLPHVELVHGTALI